MSGKGPFDPRREAPLLSAYVDGELDAEDVARVEAHLATDPAARREVEQLRGLKAVTGAMRLREAPPEAWESFREKIYNRGERSLGWLLLTIGAMIVGAWGVWRLGQALLATPAVPSVVKLALAAVGAGLAVLTVSALRERIHKRRHTRYKDVIR